MTIAEQLENRGYHKGKREEAAFITEKILSKKMDINFIQEVTGLSDKRFIKTGKTLKSIS